MVGMDERELGWISANWLRYTYPQYRQSVLPRRAIMEQMITDLQTSLMRVTEERDALKKALLGIDTAIVEESKMPDYHKTVMKRHRMEWGTLWNAIDKAMDALHGL